MKTEPYQLTLLTAEGKHGMQVAPPKEMPSDLVPGEFVMIPDAQGKPVWYVFCDKQRWWGNGRWNLSGSISMFDPGSMTEAEMHDLRRSLLKLCGWIS